MTIATTKRIAIEEYLTYNDGTDTRYELVDGELVRMSLGTGEHGDISEFLNDRFKAEIRRLGLAWVAKDMKIAIQSPRGTRWETARIPDVVVLPLAQWNGLKKRESLIPLNEPPPLLVVEVVSPSTVTVDYRAKHSEYAVLDIPEYWIVDPIDLKVTVCILKDGAYNNVIFIGDLTIVSPTFPELELTAIEVLNAGT
ncbi:Uma2 family endonuclease [Chamaesiphon sp. GL140_3_metabinner_50]|uniref:Uma2 family endonuclease n=1 Tax=Chamaesiphon sp. GL140_3_metabinner_50 TaxID=2970812 RepID=UPI0025F347B0|nr:Uma2 family endonuclease [Chamaesiphon sp. GL140_3_metabinner_50]